MQSSDMQTQPTTGGQVKAASGLNIVAGIWLIVAPFVLAYSSLMVPLWNDIIVGAVVLIFGWIRVSQPDRNVWLSWTNLVLGLWLLIAPFSLGYAGTPAAVWNDVSLGIIVAALAGWSAWATHR